MTTAPTLVSALKLAAPPRPNPFDSPVALAESSYNAYANGKLFRPFGGSPTPLEEFVHDSFRALVLNPKFSCIAARSAIHAGSYRFGQYAELGGPACVEAVARDLFSFIEERESFDSFSSFVATFREPATMDEEVFEARLWQTLRSLHQLDSTHHEWDPSVSSDPEDPAFSFSFGGHAFFVVGLHPGSSRFTRRFSFPALVFNAHSQFESMRTEGRYTRIQDIIRARDLALG
jgi:uncharacterized protein